MSKGPHNSEYVNGLGGIACSLRAEPQKGAGKIEGDQGDSFSRANN